ncbi:hypothetical protein N656DRAFT_179642 [Canariomyces notabilis]|uniref:Uncharacterized protein n=1 Tax=Canariomyces notabilis TaxID=2074819 RepID=A0AAN6TBD6_9PEZI|nr:hypothetical protein N656DRAFT_179642 [Canariomyces arenarius]
MDLPQGRASPCVWAAHLVLSTAWLASFMVAWACYLEGKSGTKCLRSCTHTYINTLQGSHDAFDNCLMSEKIRRSGRRTKTCPQQSADITGRSGPAVCRPDVTNNARNGFDYEPFIQL